MYDVTSGKSTWILDMRNSVLCNTAGRRRPPCQKKKLDVVPSEYLIISRRYNRDRSDKRKQFRHIANLKHKDPKNLSLREKYDKINKEFKNTCILKENLFWKSRMKALSEKYQTSEFWNICKFFDQNVNDKEPEINGNLTIQIFFKRTKQTLTIT